MSVLAKFAAAAARVVSALHQSEFPETITKTLMELTGAEDGTLLWFAPDRMPKVVYNTNRIDGRESTLATYLQGSFLLDPFYRAAALDGRRGVFTLKELAPRGFKNSDYFHNWYTKSGFTDECGVLLSLPKGFLHFTLTTMTPSYHFTTRRLATIADAMPAIEALVHTHWAAADVSAGPAMRRQLDRALTTFGSSVLTNREREVVELVLLGNSTRHIAEKLNLALETIKLHRKNSYAKLDISSQSELFSLFMDCMVSIPLDSDDDPLMAYHGRRPNRG